MILKKFAKVYDMSLEDKKYKDVKKIINQVIKKQPVGKVFSKLVQAL